MDFIYFHKVIYCVLLLLNVCMMENVPKMPIRWRKWRPNTNFGNLQNWRGLYGQENCSQNIYSFPEGYREQIVVALPQKILAKQVILPVNAIFVFQSGSTTFSNSGSNCQTEAKFLRTSREDWFNSNNWIENDSLVNEAIPQVERVPCQYDAVQFPSNSSFNLIISDNVSIRKFFLGDKELSYTEIALLMNSVEGKLQFKKAPETQFQLGTTDCLDNDECICDNYRDEIRHKICSLYQCPHRNIDKCPAPLLPPGFCCPICTYHMKIEHKGSLRLGPLQEKLTKRIQWLNLGGEVATYLTRFHKNFAHIVFIPSLLNRTEDVRRIIEDIHAFLIEDPEVVEVSVSKSWAEDDDDEEGALTSEGLNGGVITLIVIAALLILFGAAFLIFFWNKGRHVPITLSTITSRLPPIPDFTIPRIPTLASRFTGGGNDSNYSFGFARFTNERVSTINIGQSRSGEMQRGEQVDAPLDVDVEKTTNAGTNFGFSNVTYDIIAGTSEDGLSATSGANASTSKGAHEENKSVDLVHNAMKDEKANASSSNTTATTTLDGEEHIYTDVVEVNEDTSSILVPGLLELSTPNKSEE